MTIHELFDILLTQSPSPGRLADEKYLDKLKQQVAPLIQLSSFPRRQLLLSAGQVAGHIYFLVQGAARGYCFDGDTGLEETHFLWGPHSFVTEPGSFFRRQPSTLFIEVMPGATTFSIAYQELKDCFAKFPETEMFSRNMVLQYAVVERKRNHTLVALTAWARYLQLLQDFPDVEQRFTKAAIASYLNMRPETLSRLLKKNGHP